VRGRDAVTGGQMTFRLQTEDDAVVWQLAVRRILARRLPKFSSLLLAYCIQN